MSCPGSVRGGVPAWSLLLTVALGSVLTLSSACGLSTRSGATTPVRVTIGLADTRKNTTPSDSGIGAVTLGLTEEGLVNTARDGKPQAALAERWEPSADGLSWRFHLRPGLRCHDGTPLDATLVAASLRRGLEGGRVYAGLRDITTIEPIGPLELVIHLRRPSAIMVDSLANLAVRSPANAAIGSFRLVSRNAESVRLEAFKGDERPRSTVDQVDIRLYPDGRNAWSAMMRGEVDVLYEVAPEALDFVEQSSQAQLKSFLRPYVYMLGLNLRHPVLRSRQARLALNYAVNRDDLIKVLFRSQGMPASDPLWPRHWAFDKNLKSFYYAPTEAQRLLDTAGLTVKPSRDRRMASRLRFTCLVPTRDRYERMGLMLQRQLVESGIDMQLEPVPLQSLPARLKSGQYEAFLFESAAGSLDWNYSFWHSPEPPNPIAVR
jgi:peptide/nickel transport system substrate-binding protein